MTEINSIIDMDAHPIQDRDWRISQRQLLGQTGAIVLKHFLTQPAITALQAEAQEGLSSAYFNPQTHTVYLSPPDPHYPDDHIRNRQVLSSKGCICDDQIAQTSVLKQLYHHPLFKEALCFILAEETLYPYADRLSSVNIHYARQGEELNWHFDNSSFAVTLMISPASQGGHFEYVQNVRNADKGEMGYEQTDKIVSGKHPVQTLDLQASDLCLFRGRDALHRVSPVTDNSVRQLAVLAYNNSPDVRLSETAQRTFYGRIDTTSTAV